MSLAESRSLLADVVQDVLGDVPEDGTAHEVPGSWSTMVELGWPLVGVPESEGGAGGSLADLVAIVEGLGRTAARLPVAETALARWVAGPIAADWDPSVIATVALADSGVSGQVTNDGRIVLDGHVRDVAWASSAGHIVVESDGWVAVVEPTAEGVEVAPAANIADEPRCSVRFTSVTGTQTGPVPPNLVRDRLALLRAAAIVGAAEGALQLSLDHVRAREQFGRPIARFQLVSSAIAQMASETTVARSVVEAAVDAHTGDVEVTPRTAAAILAAARAAGIVARLSHQVHGAIGVTREHSLHRFTRRLWSWRDDAGTERSWQERLGRHAVDLGPDRFWDLLVATGRLPG